MTGSDLMSHPEPEKEVLSRNTKMFFIGILGLGVALRLYHLSEESLWYDEGGVLSYASFVDLKLTFFEFAAVPESPMQAILIAFWRGVTGLFVQYPVTSVSSDFVLRLLPCLLGIAGIPLVFFIAYRMLKDEMVALVAAFFYSICPFQIYYAQELRLYSLYVVVAMCAMYFVYRALEDNQHRHWVAMTFFLALLMYTHLISVWLIIAFNVAFVLLCIVPKYRTRFWRWFFYHVAMMVSIIPMLIMMRTLYASMQQIRYSWFPAPTLKTGFVTFKTLFAGYGFNPSIGPWFYHGLMLLALALTAYGMFSLRKKPLPLALLGGALIVPIATNVLYYMTQALCFYEHRHFIFSGVAAIILVAQGIRALPRPSLRTVAMILFVALTLPSLADFYARRMHPATAHRRGVFERIDFRSTAAYLEGRWEEGDLLAHSSTFTILSMRHYLPVVQRQLGGDIRQLTGNFAVLERHGLVPYSPENGTADAKRVWLIAASPEKITFANPDQAATVRTWLDAHFTLVASETFDGVELYLYERESDPARVARNMW